MTVDAASGPTIRPARTSEVPALDSLIAASARSLGTGFYTGAETEAAIAHVFGVDTELVADGSYFVAEAGGSIAGCGGWSRRPTLFGGNRYALREAGLLDPAYEPARIRAFFVDPHHARRGIGSAILAACEEAALAAGFTATTLMATRPGVPFYAARGYHASEPVLLDLGGIGVGFVPMDKTLVAEK